MSGEGLSAHRRSATELCHLPRFYLTQNNETRMIIAQHRCNGHNGIANRGQRATGRVYRLGAVAVRVCCARLAASRSSGGPAGRHKATGSGGPIVQNEPNLPPAGAVDGENCAKRSQTWGNWGMWTKAVVVLGVARPGSETCKTNPIWPGRRLVPEENVRNAAKLGGPGVCGQKRLSCRAWLGLGVKRAKRTQFGPAGGRCRRKLRETKPNLGQLGHVGKGRRRVGRWWAREGNVQNEPNLARPETGTGGNCAKRSQFLDCGLRIGRSRARTPNLRRAEECETKPIRPTQAGIGAGGGVIGGYCAEQSQLAAA
jgi:hypothetical protein